MDYSKIPDALKAGYSHQEILDVIAQDNPKVLDAKKAGFGDDEILQQLMSLHQETQKPQKNIISRALDKAGEMADAGPSHPITEWARGLGETALHMGSSLAGMAGQGITTLGSLAADAVQGQRPDLGKAVGLGAEVAKDLTYEPRGAKGKLTTEAIGKGFETARNAVGEYVEGQEIQRGKDMERYGRPGIDIPGISDVNPAAARTIGEAAFDLANVAPIVEGGIGGVGKAIKGRAADRLKAEKADELRRQKEQTAWPENALNQVDAIQNLYPKDLNAPQLGMGGKRVTPEDGSLTNFNRNPMDRQARMDADLAEAGKQWEAAREAPLEYTPEKLVQNVDKPLEYTNVKDAPKGLELGAEGTMGPRVFAEADILKRELGPKIQQAKDIPPVNYEAGSGVPRVDDHYKITLENAKLQAAEVMKDTSIKAAINQLERQHQIIEKVRDQLRKKGVAETNLFGKDVGLSAGAAKELRPVFNRLNKAIEKANEMARKVDEKFVRKVSKTPTTAYPIEKTVDGRELLRGPGKSQRGVFDPEILKTSAQDIIDRILPHITNPARISKLRQRLGVPEDAVGNWGGEGKLRSELEEIYMELAAREYYKQDGSVRPIESSEQRMNKRFDEAEADGQTGEINKQRWANADQVAKEKLIDALASENAVDIHTSTVKGGRPGGKQAGVIDFGLSDALNRLISRSKKSDQTGHPPTATSRSGARAIADAAHEPMSLEQAKANPEFATKDLKDNIGMTLLKNVTNTQFLGHLTDNPFVKWAHDNITSIFRKNDMRSMEITHGTVYKLGSAIVDNPRSPHAVWEGLSKTDKNDLAMIANKFSGRHELTKGELKRIGLSDAAADAYAVFVKAYKDIREQVNSISDKPLAELPGYFAMARDGDYKVTVKDKATGETLWSDLYWNRYKAKYDLATELADRFKGEYDVSVEPVKKNRGNPYNVSTMPFEELMHTLQRDDPRREAIASAISEIKGRRGFGRHNIQRKFIEGGELNADNFYKTFQNYVDSAMRYKSNIELQNFGKNAVGDMDLKLPNAKEWLKETIDLHRGGHNPGFLVKAAEGAAQLITYPLGFGESFPKKALSGLNSYFMYKALFSYRPAFLLSQTLQPATFMPQWISHYKAQGYNGSFWKSIYQGNAELIKAKVGGKVDPQFRAFVEDYMMPRGEISPQLVHHMQLFGKDTKGVGILTGHTLAEVIEQGGRLETAAVGYHFFKDAGLKGSELFKAAEQFTKDVMVDYNRENAPTWIGKSGIVGQAAGPLSTFATNFWSTTATFLYKDAWQKRNVAPIAIHIAQTAVWGGLTGMLLTKEADMVIDLINWVGKKGGWLDKPIKTVTERILTSDLGKNKATGDLASFGVASQATGMNVGASMAAPDIRGPSANTFPGIKLLIDATTAAHDAVTHQTAASFKQLAKVMSPNMIAAQVDLVGKNPGDVLQNAAKRDQATVRLGENEILAHRLGTTTLNEVRTKAGTRSAKQMQEHMDAVKPLLVDKAVDTLLGLGKENISELGQRAADIGMRPEEFVRAVKKAYMSRQVEERIRNIGKGNTPAQAQRYMRMQEFVPKDE